MAGTQKLFLLDRQVGPPRLTHAEVVALVCLGSHCAWFLEREKTVPWSKDAIVTKQMFCPLFPSEDSQNRPQGAWVIATAPKWNLGSGRLEAMPSLEDPGPRKATCAMVNICNQQTAWDGLKLVSKGGYHNEYNDLYLEYSICF